MATKTTPKKTGAKTQKASANPKTVPIEDLLDELRKKAIKHIDVVRRVRTALAPKSWIILNSDTTEK